MFCENQEYIFDEDKNTKQEIEAIWKLLKTQNEEFWTLQKHFVVSELNEEKDRILSVLPVIAEFNIKESIDIIKKLLEINEDEVVICEALSTLKTMQILELSDIQKVENKIKWLEDSIEKLTENTSKALEKLNEIFSDVVNSKSFGNGRYVRNLLEQAMLNRGNKSN